VSFVVLAKAPVPFRPSVIRLEQLITLSMKLNASIAAPANRNAVLTHLLLNSIKNGILVLKMPFFYFSFATSS
jgi:hypothetical protein